MNLHLGSLYLCQQLKIKQFCIKGAINEIINILIKVQQKVMKIMGKIIFSLTEKSHITLKLNTNNVDPNP